MQEQRLSNQQCNELHLPGRSPIWPHEELDWFTFETPTHDVRTCVQFETAAAILGDGKAAA